MTTSTSTRKAVVITRISDARDGEHGGVDRQETDCRALCTREDLHVVAVLTENDTSAYTRRRIAVPGSDRPVLRVIRPKFRQALDMLWNRQADVLVAYDLDRTVRDPRDLEDLIEITDLVRDDVRKGRSDRPEILVRSVTGSLDFGEHGDDPTTARIFVAIANKSSRDTARRVARKRQELAAEGRFTGGPRPYGYTSDGMTVVPDEADVVREIARRILTRESLHSIVRWLTDQGVPSTTGKPWTLASVRTIMTSPRIAGISSYKGVEQGPGQWPEIIPEDIYRGVAAMLTDPARKTSPGNKPRHLGSGLYLCGRCGSPMRSSTKRYGSGRLETVYRCTSQAHLIRKAEPLDLEVTALILRRLPYTSPRRSNGIDVAAVQQTIAAAKASLDKADDDHFDPDGLLDDMRYRRQVDRLTKRIAEAEATLTRAAHDTHDPVRELATSERPAWVWESYTLEQQREILALLVTITVQPGTRSHGFDPEREISVRWHGDDEQPAAVTA